MQELFNKLMFRLGRCSIAKDNLYKLFISKSLLVNALVHYDLIDKNISTEELDEIVEYCQCKWLEIKDVL